MLQRTIILDCDNRTHHPELLEFTAHLERLVEKIPEIDVLRRWSRHPTATRVELDLDSNNRPLTIEVADLIINLVAHTPFTVR